MLFRLLDMLTVFDTCVAYFVRFLVALEPGNLVLTLIWISLSIRITIIVDPRRLRCLYVVI
ncbi:hypothetical protein Hanom_Chr05g00467321 [Helianthus anomalus]